MSFKKTIERLYKILEKDLSPKLTYHGIHHTRDVHDVCKFYIKHYKIKKDDARTCEIMRDEGFSDKEIRKVRKMILATKVPQSPKSMLAEILCDSDLDYLGREDFKSIGKTLKEEWKNYKFFPNVEEDFDIIQIGFLKGHSYHTEYAQKYRSPEKIKHIERLEEKQKTKYNKKSK